MFTTDHHGNRVFAAVAFEGKPEWPVYEAPARWYIQPGPERPFGHR